MARSKKTKNSDKAKIISKKTPDPHVQKRLRHGFLVLCSAFCAYLLTALLSFNPQDPAWSQTSSLPVENITGPIGAYLADITLYFGGYMAYALVAIILIGSIEWLIHSDRDYNPVLSILKVIGVVLLCIGGSTLFALLIAPGSKSLPQGAGGIAGNILMLKSISAFNYYGSILIHSAVALLGLSLYVGLGWMKHLKHIRLLFKGIYKLFKSITNGFKKIQAKKQQAKEEEAPQEDLFQAAIPEQQAPPPPTSTPEIIQKQAPEKITKKALKTPSPKNAPYHGQVPDINLLDKAKNKHKRISKDVLEATAALVEEKLTDFGIQAQVAGILPGPIITRYELQLAAGTKVSKLSSLAKDIARALSAMSVRVVEVIPGKSVVGLELPNKDREIVRLKEVLAADNFSQSISPLTLGIGKDISGEPVSVNLGKMPHLLVAGTTGSGKSVGINAMILSMLFKATPQQLRLILIDPKMLELSVYEGIPHLLTPVVTDMKQAAVALRWCVREMDRRYSLMASVGVRNVEGLNDKIARAKAGDEVILREFANLDPNHNFDEIHQLQHLPFIVVVVDELADMMMVVGKQVEELIARIAQKARACGMHLILATQRPSVDVITGLIKANIPTRMAFQVSSRIDSRTILDEQGAENLLGYGDMLYMPPGTSIAQRVHGAFVSDDEVHKVVQAWKNLAEVDYIAAVIDETSDKATQGTQAEPQSDDPLYLQAIDLVIESKRASISSIQRRLKIGYNRAARMIEQMEEDGIVSGIGSNGMREVLSKKREHS